MFFEPRFFKSMMDLFLGLLHLIFQAMNPLFQYVTKWHYLPTADSEAALALSFNFNPFFLRLNSVL